MQSAQLGSVPEWLAVALVTAALATLGFVGKQVHEWIVTVSAARRSRRARLVTLLSLLNGTAAVRRVQDELRDRLFTTVMGRCRVIRENGERVRSPSCCSPSTDERPTEAASFGHPRLYGQRIKASQPGDEPMAAG